MKISSTFHSKWFQPILIALAVFLISSESFAGNCPSHPPSEADHIAERNRALDKIEKVRAQEKRAREKARSAIEGQKCAEMILDMLRSRLEGYDDEALQYRKRILEDLKDHSVKVLR